MNLSAVKRSVIPSAYAAAAAGVARDDGARAAGRGCREDLGETAKRVVRVEGGVCRLDPELVSADTQVFLAAVREGNFARKAGRAAAALAAYQHARELYTGPLLPGEDAHHPWLEERLDGVFTLRELYRRRERQVTERLAELLRAGGRASDAAPLYRDLMRDPGPPDPARDDIEVRENHAQALFTCYRELSDAHGLAQAYEDLLAVLRRYNAEAEAEGASEPSSATVQLFETLRRELAARERGLACP
jgi:hypothetical protein